MRKKPSNIQMLSFLASLAPAIWFLINYTQGAYSSYPTLFLIQFSGKWAIIFLLASLTCTPLRILLSLNSILQARKIIGLAAFYYAAVHAGTFIILDYQFNLRWLIPEFQTKPYLLLGLAALLLLLCLALTSGKTFQRKFSKLWIKIHRFVYLIGLLVLLHSYFAIKGEKSTAFVNLAIYLILMLLRIPAIRDKISLKDHKTFQNLNHWLNS